MSSFNKVILYGNMTRAPQLSYLPSNTAVVEFAMAMNRTFRKQDGSQGEEVCYVDCQMFGKRAEVINKYFQKGDPIFVEGRLKFDSWQAQDGSKRSKLRVFVENFEFVGGRSGGSSSGTPPQALNQHGGGEPDQNEAFNPVDDIPF